MRSVLNIVKVSLVMMAFKAGAMELKTEFVDFNNGCGSGWNEPLVPEEIKLMGVNFAQACAEHDNCYSKCLPGGDYYGKEICGMSSTEQKEGRRGICDVKFEKDLLSSCTKLDLVRRPMCEMMAYIYSYTVRMGGEPSFEGYLRDERFLNYLTTDGITQTDVITIRDTIRDLKLMSEITQGGRLSVLIENEKPFLVIDRLQESGIVNKKADSGVLVIEIGSAQVLMPASQSGFITEDLLFKKGLQKASLEIKKDYKSRLKVEEEGPGAS